MPDNAFWDNCRAVCNEVPRVGTDTELSYHKIYLPANNASINTLVAERQIVRGCSPVRSNMLECRSRVSRASGRPVALKLEILISEKLKMQCFST